MAGKRLELVVVVVAVVHTMACMMVVDKMDMMDMTALVGMDCRPLVLPMSTMMGRMMGRMIVDTMGMAVDRMMVEDRMVVGKMELLDMNLFEFIDRLYFMSFFCCC